MRTLASFLISCSMAFSCFAQVPSILWQASYGGSGEEKGYMVQQTGDGGFVIAGYTASVDGDVTGPHGGTDVWVMKVNDEGVLQWQHAYGGMNDDEARSIDLTTDGGFILAGRTRSNDGDVIGHHGRMDAWVLKLDSNGTLEWNYALGGSENDHASEVHQTSDEGYIVVGTSSSDDGDVSGVFPSIECPPEDRCPDMWVAKLNAMGELVWQHALGGPLLEAGYTITEITGGGYVAAGYATGVGGDVSEVFNQGNSDIWVVHLDDEGELIWETSIGGGIDDEPRSVKATPDGGCILSGGTSSSNGDMIESHGSLDAVVIKMSAGGEVEWLHQYGGSDEDWGYGIACTADGGYALSCYCMSLDGQVTGHHGWVDTWLIKLNDQGTLQWQRALGGTQIDWPYSTQQTSDHGYVIAGYSDSDDGDVSGNHGTYDVWVVRLGNDEGHVGINELDQTSLTLIPNPTRGSVRVINPYDAPVLVTLLDPMGRVVRSEPMRNSYLVMDLSALSAGVYTVQVSGRAGVRSARVVVE